jgi:hypothetical protein
MLRILCQTKVDQAHFSILTIHDILWFDVAMRYTQSVAVLESLEALMDNFRSSTLSIRFSLLDVRLVTVKELATSAHFHDQVEVMLIIVRFKVLDNIWMVYLLEEIDLIHDVSQVFRRHFMFVKDLDSNLELRVLLIDALVNFSKCTFTNNCLIDLILLFELVDTGSDVHSRRLFFLLQI